ncbi:hypothetical protein Asppvi_010107 [Aspergillus pseudoviridinutans]|uniref:Uncharacterized protein n=1 Tax=Aspergillus pseudoviridinutans TaxID=1517512 RepID=A0A9P3BH10_9EURO|nr:uncharacterized protein Asppvi_010107 [Aspergillus pseudoviridinutans]GIJ91142.1 hypothetical protein Asppvi_010107 [Aspergillus pseudoviridinutans]
MTTTFAEVDKGISDARAKLYDSQKRFVDQLQAAQATLDSAHVAQRQRREKLTEAKNDAAAQRAKLQATIDAATAGYNAAENKLEEPTTQLPPPSIEHTTGDIGRGRVRRDTERDQKGCAGCQGLDLYKVTLSEMDPRKMDRSKFDYSTIPWGKLVPETVD